MEGLAYDEESGELIDQETGKPLKALNENGATRFDVAVRAMRGEFDRPGVEPEQDTEEAAASSGAILDALVHFPAPYTFQVVGPKGGAAGPEDISAFEEDVVACIARVLSAPPEMLEVSSKERSGGKYLSVSVVGTVSSPLLLDHVFSALDEMDRVMMRF